MPQKFAPPKISNKPTLKRKPTSKKGKLMDRAIRTMMTVNPRAKKK